MCAFSTRSVEKAHTMNMERSAVKAKTPASESLTVPHPRIAGGHIVGWFVNFAKKIEVAALVGL
jgi:hypothetical protein